MIGFHHYLGLQLAPPDKISKLVYFSPLKSWYGHLKCHHYSIVATLDGKNIFFFILKLCSVLSNVRFLSLLYHNQRKPKRNKT